jgi:hypothetical protein
MLATLPRGSMLFVDGDDAFVLAYATQVRGERPDVTLVDRRGLLFASARLYGGGAGDAEREGARDRPRRACLEPRPLHGGGQGYELPDGWRFEPEGLFFRVRRSGEPLADTAPLWSSYHEAEIALEAAKRPGAFADAVAATYPLMRAEEALARGRPGRRRPRDGRSASPRPSKRDDPEHDRHDVGRRGDLPRAVAAFERAVAAKPQSLRGWLNLAQARALSGDRSGAREAAAKARALAGADPRFRTGHSGPACRESRTVFIGHATSDGPLRQASQGRDRVVGRPAA